MRFSTRIITITIIMVITLVSFDDLLAESGSDQTDAYQLGSRWIYTQSSGYIPNQGSPMTITWGFLAEGTTIPAEYPTYGETSSPSILIASLDAAFGSGSGGPDYTQRPWFTHFASSFDRMSSLCGLTEVYTPADDGAPFSVSSGILGTRADVRIGGHRITGPGGILAYNWYPSRGDMVIDTDDMTVYFNNPTNNFRTLRNMLMHEHGHGVGLKHNVSIDSSFLLEPILDISFDGPQFDDVLALQRHYGDVNEKANGGYGNDTAGNAIDLGVVFDGTLSIGLDASDKVVASTDTDFVSIDDDSDTDFFSFTVTGNASANITLTPLGPTYLQGPSSSSQSTFIASAQSDLTLEIFDTDGSTSLGMANVNGLGSAEMLTNVSLAGPGTYFVKVSGADDEAQFYQLDMDVTPEPATLSLLALGALAILKRKRK